MTKLKKVISIFLVALLFTSINLNTFAQDLSNTTKTNFNFISIDDLSNVVYTYQENGKEYMVKEHANEDLTEVSTNIYELNETEDYTLTESYVTNINIENGSIEVMTTDKNDITTIDHILVKDIVEVSTDQNINTRALSGWVHIYNYSGSVKFTKYTLTVVIATLSGAVASLSGITFITGGAVAGAASIAQIIVNERLPYAYMKQKGYYYYPNSSGIPTKMRHVTDCYRNSNGTGYLGTTTAEGEIRYGGN